MNGLGRKSNRSYSNSFPVAPSAAPTELKNPAVTADSKADILVAGSVAVDLSCDYAPKSGDTSPVLHTSNPSSISQSIGGVGHNVALAAHSVSKHARVRLCSMVGDDV
jgi:pseudouridine-5'-phosphate glycosidase/pseudouridine kinase